jgi:hypothetical protein
MTSEGTSTVPRMGSFQRAILGYRRPDVDAAISARDLIIEDLRLGLADKEELEAELGSLSDMVIERERVIRGLNERLRDANALHDRSIASLDAVTARLQEIEAQARGQATRIRMKALREAVEVSQRAQELIYASGAEGQERAAEPEAAEPEEAPKGLFAGEVKVEIGPLGDYSQLVGIEDAIEGLGASEISIERFSEGRATLSMQLDEPVDLLRELEEHSALEFRVRRVADDNLVLDVDDDDGSEHRAA